MQPRLWLLVAAKLAVLQGSGGLLQNPGSLVLQTNQVAAMSCDFKTTGSNSRIYWLRQRQAPSEDSHHEFLASQEYLGNVTYGEAVTPRTLTLTRSGARVTLNLKHTKPEDSGIYFCMTIGSPELIFGRGTTLSVVDVLPTTAQPTQKLPPGKLPPGKKKCQPPSPRTQKGLRCGHVTLSLLVASVLLLLLSLAVAVHLYCLRRRARLRFIKQFYK
ncbi:PREDICTED: T-cell surface glycoprotein CD8 beta chain [Chinchilla lanigera]|uniref:T-cell surface glycoprotein CD8 beta chain n=1 Tax=Chinchilla lanigera TaxID=34839 RepID=A0A8C2V0C4_CHILA|nr:PREDICTED: T-cell surface glycoprotein CD8 beta chain [Chinchilla lanigera]